MRIWICWTKQRAFFNQSQEHDLLIASIRLLVH